MSLEVVIKSNTDKFLLKLNSDINKFENALTKSKNQIGKHVRQKAKRYAPTLTGNLENSIVADIKGDSVIIGVASGSKAGKYAHIMEYGDYERGDRTRSKGSKAGRLFLSRSVEESDRFIVKNLKGLSGVLK